MRPRRPSRRAGRLVRRINDEGIDEIRGTFLDETTRFEFDEVEISGNGHILFVPEPGTLTLACVAGAAFVGVRRRLG